MHSLKIGCKADDHGQVLEEILRLLQQEFEILAALSDGALTVRAVGDLKPQVAVLDIEMPVMNGFESAEQITKMGIPAKIVFLSIYRDSDYIQCANAKGASHVPKSKMQSDLLTAVGDPLDGRNFTSNL